MLPEWTKSGIIEYVLFTIRITRLTCVRLDSSSDEERGKAKGTKTKANKNGRSGSPEEQNHKRPRSRSRSLTPPPQLSNAQIQNARLAVRYVLLIDLVYVLRISLLS